MKYIELHKYLNEMMQSGIKYMSMEASSQASKHDRIFGMNFKNECYGVRVTICSNIYLNAAPIYYEAICIYQYPQSNGLMIKELISRSSVTITTSNDTITIEDTQGVTYLNIRLDLI